MFPEMVHDTLLIVGMGVKADINPDVLGIVFRWEGHTETQLQGSFRGTFSGSWVPKT